MQRVVCLRVFHVGLVRHLSSSHSSDNYADNAIMGFTTIANGFEETTTDNSSNTKSKNEDERWIASIVYVSLGIFSFSKRGRFYRLKS